jgi:hypothetical protein
VYTIWRTGHSINETVVAEFRKGTLTLSRLKEPYTIKDISFYDPSKKPPPSISYGFLRGAETIFQACEKHGVEYWEIDKGYFKPNHFDGYYRISLNNIRAHYNNALDLPADRWQSLNINIAPWRDNPKGYILLCPPTDAVCHLKRINKEQWIDDIKSQILMMTDRPIRVRDKNDNNTPVEYDLDNAHAVVTYNSNIAINGLIRGIPAFILDKTWQTPSLYFLEDKERFIDRETLFHFLSYCQFTLEEFRTGRAWEISQQIQKYGVLNA